MTTDVSVQSAYVAIIPDKLVVATQTAYVAIFEGTRLVVSEQSAYLALFDVAGSPPTGRRRRIMNVMVG